MNPGAIKAYWHIGLMASREDRANPARIAGSVALGVLRMILLSVIYRAAYHVAGHGRGLPYANALWSIGLYFALILGLSMRHVFKLVDYEVKSGAVEVGLIKPLDWRLIKVCQQLGRNAVECVLLVAAFAVTLTIVVGVPSVQYVTLVFVVGYVVLVVLAIISASALYMAVGLTAFWLNDAQPTFRIVDKIIMIVGGAFVPIALLPDVVQTILRYSPFTMYAASTQLFNPGLARHLWPTVVASVFWTAATIGLCHLMWKRAERRIEINGG